MGLSDSLTANLLDGASVEVKSTVFPPFTVDLTPSAPGAPSNFFMRVAKPKVTLLKNGEVVYSSAPSGEPDSAVQLWPFAVALIALLVAYWVFK